jgi:hypothetical protein
MFGDKDTPSVKIKRFFSVLIKCNQNVEESFIVSFKE